jgi:hypothetical protein
MTVTPTGDASHIMLCEGISGSGTSVTYDNTLTSVYIKCEEPEFGIDFDSKIKNLAYGKSRLTTDLKYKQALSCTNGVILSSNVNTVTEWLMGRYIAKAAIYLLVEIPQATGSTYDKKSWYNDSQTKVYYCKGHVGKLKIKMTKGRVFRINFDFKECWT